MHVYRLAAGFALPVVVVFSSAAAELPEAIAAKGETVVLQVQAQGAQIYECRAATQATGHPSWQFREPVASLFREGKTVGRHYTGPTWEIGDSIVTGKVIARADAPNAKDIPWLKLDVANPADDGPLQDVTAVQRINTLGGVLDGACDKVGELRAEPYAADYVFLKKPQ